jgi:hypothetical protein
MVKAQLIMTAATLAVANAFSPMQFGSVSLCYDWIGLDWIIRLTYYYL